MDQETKCMFIAKQRDGGVEVEYLYKCDPDKHKRCKKTSCKKNGGDCEFTLRPECRANDKKYLINIITGEPMEIKGDEEKLFIP